MAPIRQEEVNSASKVKGPIRCHKCQLMCRDAEHYLSRGWGKSSFFHLHKSSKNRKHRVNDAAGPCIAAIFAASSPSLTLRPTARYNGFIPTILR